MSTKNFTDVKSTVKLAPKQNTAPIEPNSFAIKVDLPYIGKGSSFNGQVIVDLYHESDVIHHSSFPMIQNIALDSYVQTAFSNYQRYASIPKD